MIVKAFLIFLAVLLPVSVNQTSNEANGFEKAEASTTTCEEAVLTKKQRHVSARVYSPKVSYSPSPKTNALLFNKITIATQRYLLYRSLRT